MEGSFRTEIISPEKVIFSGECSMMTLPGYEGDMSILKNHIPIITFLRPGLIKLIDSSEKSEVFFIQDGVVEFFNNILVILSSSVISVKDLSKDFVEKLNKDTSDKLSQKDITDHDRYILNHKLDVIKQLAI